MRAAHPNHQVRERLDASDAERLTAAQRGGAQSEVNRPSGIG